ncbi:hypothetical protein KC332_g1869 [Hortaea werneckii]|nr:hypothetical protein KC358_g1156 [Hortaea werneckii]OTA24295.1 hypothetical protein BTJ68_11817 [Hortaea werneckii EXF-2000]KAI6851507.1 hypothetical protein KC350_g1599 [Hortaea werneckii]KAI6927386.1 hypothetical protein KC341_g12150 [Hortaea werneckii]KAI6949194.1 hypothetical protein KC348_g1488 [Hortaea werneckii]
MTYDLYQLSKSRSKDGALKLSSEEGKRHLAKAARQEKERERERRSTKKVEDVFIGSLVAAGSCRRHSSRMGCGWVAETRPRRERERIRKGWNAASRVQGPRREFSTYGRHGQHAALAVQPPEEEVKTDDIEISREEYHDLVETYDSPGEMMEPDVAPPSSETKQPHIPLAPRLVIPPEQEDLIPRNPRQVLEPEDDYHASTIHRLQRLLAHEPGRISLPKLWSLYQSLPAELPPVRYLADDDLRLAFRHLSWVEYPSREHDSSAYPRYLTLLEDCLAENVPITPSEWNSAIAFAGRWARYATNQEVKSAVEMWMRMERSGTPATNVTFNILFDVAVKAGRFALAETIFKELEARRMPLNRFFRTGMIYFAGMKGDGEGVRKAFRDLVAAEEIVDTAVMNCVIRSLVRAGEPAAAEHVFGKMKHLYKGKMGTSSPRNWQSQKELGTLLDRTARRLRREKKSHENSFFGGQFSSEERREEVQKLSPIQPNARTYRILIHHHCYTTGDLARVQELVQEMRREGWHVHGSVYVHIIRGFCAWGGTSHTAWSRTLLEEIWANFLEQCRPLAPLSSPEALSSELLSPTSDGIAFPSPDASAADSENPSAFDPPADNLASDDSFFVAEESEENRAPYVTRTLAHAVVRAFYKCAGPNRMREVWKEIEERWRDAEDEHKESIRVLMQKLEGGWSR